MGSAGEGGVAAGSISQGKSRDTDLDRSQREGPQLPAGRTPSLSEATWVLVSTQGPLGVSFYLSGFQLPPL